MAGGEGDALASAPRLTPRLGSRRSWRPRRAPRGREPLFALDVVCGWSAAASGTCSPTADVRLMTLTWRLTSSQRPWRVGAMAIDTGSAFGTVTIKASGAVEPFKPRPCALTAPTSWASPRRRGAGDRHRARPGSRT